jgi:murein DD-endopeptidase MepM/ murein hydrolase activator NlpD
MGALPRGIFDELIESYDKVDFSMDNAAKKAARKIAFDTYVSKYEISRIKYYLNADRTSTLGARDSKGIMQAFIDALNNKQGETRKRSPRLSLENKDSDFTAVKDETAEIFKGNNADVVNAASAIQGQLTTIKNEIRPDEDRIKNLTDKAYADSNINKGLISKEPYNGTLRNYEIKDKIFKLMEPYALSWPLLLLMDQAILFESEEEFKKADLDNFMEYSLAKFMPEYDVVRHLKREYRSIQKKEKADPNDPNSAWVDIPTQNTFKLTPVYFLERVDAWNQTITSPVVLKKTTEEISTVTEDGTETYHETRISIEPIVAMSKYASPAPVNTPEHKLKIEFIGSSGAVYKMTPKYDEVKAEFAKYGIYEDTFAKVLEVISSEEGVSYFNNAAIEIAKVFGLKLNFIPFFGAGTGFTANIQYILDTLPDRKLTLLLKDNINYINQICPQNGIPAPVMIAQLIQEIGWDMKIWPETNNLFNIKGTGPAGSKSYNGSNWRVYNNYQESIDDYVKLITTEYQYAIEAAKTGGIDAYARALQSKPDHMYCEAETPPYEESLLGHIVGYKLSSGGSAGGFTGSSPIGNGTYLLPLRNGNSITSLFGWRVHPVFGTTKFHSGLDFGAEYDEPVYASTNGTVIFAGNGGGYGNRVELTNGSDGNTYTSYNHLNQINVSVGQVVKAGDVVGLAGSTGYSTGPHLHYEISINGECVDPAPLLGISTE